MSEIPSSSKSAISMHPSHFTQQLILKESICFDHLDHLYIEALYDAMTNAYLEHKQLKPEQAEAQPLLTIDISQFAESIKIMVEASLNPENGAHRIKLGYTDSGIVKRFNQWIELGFFQKTRLKRKGFKSLNHYIMVAPSKVMTFPKRIKKSIKDPRVSRLEMIDKRKQLIHGGELLFELNRFNEQSEVKTERLFNSVFNSCIRLSTHDPRKDSIETTYYFGLTKSAEKIKIITKTTSEIMVLDDQTTLLAIVSMICNLNRRREEDGKPHSNSYLIDIRPLCRMLGLEPSGGNRDTVRKRIQRIYDTQFEIICPPNSRFAKHFDLFSHTEAGEQLTVDERHYRFITEMDITHQDLDENNEVASRPSMFRISIHSDTYKKMLDPDVWNTYSVPPELLRSSGMVFALYQFASYQLGRTVKKNRESKEFMLAQLHSLLFPASSFNNFKRTFFDQFKSHFKSHGVEWSDSKQSINTINLFGWWIEFSFIEQANDYQIKITRDQNDNYVGSKSLHNRILANQNSTLESQTTNYQTKKPKQDEIWPEHSLNLPDEIEDAEYYDSDTINS